MQINNQRWPPGSVTKNNINIKMTISQEPLIEIGKMFICLLYEAIFFFFFFFNFVFQDGRHLPFTKNGAKNRNHIISITAEWILTKFVSEWFLY